MNMESKKYRLIERITDIQSEQVLHKIEQVLNDLATERDIISELHQSIAEKLDLAALIQEKNYHGVDRVEFDRLIQEMDIQEPVEELLAMLTP